MTEDEAKSKWCPFVRFTHPHPDSGIRWNNRGPDLVADDDSKCVASNCMAWQWKYPGPNDEATGDGWKPTHGYCGVTKSVTK